MKPSVFRHLAASFLIFLLGYLFSFVIHKVLSIGMINLLVYSMLVFVFLLSSVNFLMKEGAFPRLRGARSRFASLIKSCETSLEFFNLNVMSWSKGEILFAKIVSKIKKIHNFAFLIFALIILVFFVWFLSSYTFLGFSAHYFGLAVYWAITSWSLGLDKFEREIISLDIKS
jgi:hypothetical protein